MNKTFGIVLAVIVVIGGAYIAMGGDKEEAMMAKESTGDTVMVKDEMMKKDETQMADKEMDKGEAMMKVGSYESYAPEKITRAETGKVVLFFHASWCPSCRGLNTDIENNLKSIPEGVSILKTDYDKEVELKKKYGVTYQHTLVQVDKNGNMIKKWSGGGKLSNLLSEIK